MSERIEEIRERLRGISITTTQGIRAEPLVEARESDIAYLLAKLEAAEEMADVIESKYAVEGDLHDALRRYREAGESDD